MVWRVGVLLAATATLLTLSTSAVAQSRENAELHRRLESAEKRIRELEEANQRPQPPNGPAEISCPMVSRTEIESIVAEALESEKEQKQKSRPTVTAFGRMHLESLFFPDASPGIGYFENPGSGVDPEDRIQFRRIRLGAQGDILQNGMYRVELDFGNPSRTTFRDVFVGFKDLPLLQTVLIGNQKRPLGLDSWNSNQFVVFLERPLAVNAFNPNFRRIGMQTYGYTQSEVLNWQCGVFELQDVKDIGRYLGDSLQLSCNARISSTPWYDASSGGRGYLHLGVSNMFADTDANAGFPDTNRNEARFNARPELQTSLAWLDTGVILRGTSYDVLGFESVVNVGSLQLTSEYLTTRVDRVGESNLHFAGGYFQAAWMLTGEHEPWDRKRGRLGRVVPFENFFLVNRIHGGVGGGWGAWQIAARWSCLSLSDKDIHGGREDNATIGLNWYWTAYSKVVLNVVEGRIHDRTPISGYTSGQFTGLGLRVMMDF